MCVQNLSVNSLIDYFWTIINIPLQDYKKNAIKGEHFKYFFYII